MRTVSKTCWTPFSHRERASARSGMIEVAALRPVLAVSIAFLAVLPDFGIPSFYPLLTTLDR